MLLVTILHIYGNQLFMAQYVEKCYRKVHIMLQVENYLTSVKKRAILCKETGYDEEMRV